MKKNRSVLIVGEGVIARAIAKKWSSSGGMFAQSGKRYGQWHLDLSRVPDCWHVPARPAWVFVCAGITSRTACEKDPWISRIVNVYGGIRVATYFQNRDTKVVFLGTDLLAGEGEYAQQKEDLRRMVLPMANCFWIKLGKVIHPGLPILQEWSNALRKKTPIQAYGDVWISPMSPEAVAECAWRMVHGFQATGKEMVWRSDLFMNYRELAVQWTRSLGKSRVEIDVMSRNRAKGFSRSEPTQTLCGVADCVRQVDRRKWWWN